MIQLCNLDVLQDLEFLKKLQHSLFYDRKHHLQPLGHGGAVKIFSQIIADLINNKSVCRAAPDSFPQWSFILLIVENYQIAS